MSPAAMISFAALPANSPIAMQVALIRVELNASKSQEMERPAINYASSQYFASEFRKKYGVSPKNYKCRICG